MFSFKKYFTDSYIHLLILLLGYIGKLRGLIHTEKNYTKDTEEIHVSEKSNAL